ncbi:MAG TPA: phosphatidylglycerol lysyltransferase domain-containing protein [Rhodocyclaceae bacterium]|nr:phosphatidylglycerol lysyltransferase domain-containing protein [Rhodocyclaceae bacterium]
MPSRRHSRPTDSSVAHPLPAPPGLRLPLGGIARLLRLASPLAGIFFFGLALWSLQRSSLGAYSYEEIVAALAELPVLRVVSALALTVVGYLALVGYDLLAFRFIRWHIALRGMVATSLISNALSYNLGNTAVTGAALRFWLYGSLGLSTTQIARVAVFCSGGFWLGYLFLGALLFSFIPVHLPAGIALWGHSPRPLGLAFFVIFAGYLLVTGTRRPLRLGHWRLKLPPPRLTLGQVLVASIDLCLMAGVLYVLLPRGGDLTYFRFLPLFLVGLMGGTVSQVPGGLGVFETVMVLLLAPWFEDGDLLASLLAFRGIYFVLPLFASLAFLALRRLPEKLPGPHGFLEEFGRCLATLGAIAMTGLFVLARLIRRPCPSHVPAPRKDIERARPLVEGAADTYGNLVYRGDKALLFSERRDAFLMYGRIGKTWVAMGDPIGAEPGIREVARRFRDLARDNGGWCAFFEVRAEHRELYARLGLTLTQVGEEARVHLPSFCPDHPGLKELRRAHARTARLGCRFEILPREAVPTALPALEQVSDAWLARKATCEKSFSGASFDGDYLAHFPVAVVFRGEEIIAFANLWQGAGKEELSIDLMRHRPDAPHGVMDFLFCELLLWGREQGFRWFNFGLAPLAGLDRKGDCPLWNPIGGFIYRHGRRFYNCRGLRRYKDKFGPVWTPLYLASPGGLALGPVLVEVTALMAGGFPGVICKARPSAGNGK